MGVRLFNQTRHPNRVLRQALVYAARRIGVPGEIVVLVKPARPHVHGMMHQGFPFLGYLKRWSRAKRARSRSDMRLLGRSAGWYEIWLPEPRSGRVHHLAHWLADRFVEVAMHESAHVRDFRTIRDADFMRTERHPSGRRVAYDQRRAEISANNQTEDALPTSRRGKERREAIVASITASLMSPDTHATTSSRTVAAAASSPPPDS